MAQYCANIAPEWGHSGRRLFISFFRQLVAELIRSRHIHTVESLHLIHMAMRIKTLPTVLFLATLLLSKFSSAQTTSFLGYYPNTTLNLGKTFDLDNPQVPHSNSPFVESFEVDSQNTAGNSEILYSIVSNYASLQQALNVDAYLGVSNIGYSVSSSYQMSSSSFYSSNSVTLAISAKCDYGTVSVTNYELDDEAQDLIDAGDYDQFRNIYGDSYVAGKSLGVSACIFVTLKNLTQSQYNQLSASIDGQVGSVVAGGAFNSAIQSASSSGSLVVEIKTNGGNNWASFASQVLTACAGSSPINDIQIAFSAFLESFTIDNANTTGFTFGPLSQFAPINPSSLLNIKVEKLRAIYASYYDIYTKNELLEEIVASDFYQDFHNEGDEAEALNLSAQYEYALNTLYNAYMACKADPCSNPFTCCNNPQFNINDQFLYKFNPEPFSSCVYGNSNWAYAYVNHAFTLTHTGGVVAGVGADFFNCAPFPSILARKKVNITANGSVYNPGTPNGQCGIPNDHYWFQLGLETTTVDGVNSIIPGATLGAGNAGFNLSNVDNVDSVGDDGVLNIRLFNYDTYCSSSSNLTLLTGATITVSVIGEMPSVPAMITPSEVLMCEGETATLTANSCANCTYLWNTGATSQSITVSTTGNYYVTVTDLTSSTTSYWSTVTVVPIPDQPIVTSSNATILCEGSTNQLTANSDGCIDCTYSWSTGQTGETISVNAPGTYTVIATNACGQGVTSQPLTLSLSPLPPEPTFTVNGCILETPYVAGYDYQWYLNDVYPLEGDTTRFCFADTTGFFSVAVTDANGCTSQSFNTMDTLLYCDVGMSESIALQQVLIHPNPAVGSFWIRNLPANNHVYLQIFSPLGDVVLRKNLMGLSECMVEADFAKGLYLVGLTDGERSVWRKLLVE